MSAGETRQLDWFRSADLIRQKIENGGRRTKLQSVRIETYRESAFLISW